MSKAPHEAIIYLHMAKTGGATLGAILNKQFTQDQIVLPGMMKSDSALGVLPTDQVVQRFKKMPRQAWAKVRMVPGHFMFGVHDGIPAPARYLTLLRHPVGRVISSYYYILEQPGIPVREKILARNLGLAEYVESGLGLDPHNYQTRILAGSSEFDATWENTKDVLSAPLPSSALELAIQNLENHFSFIGVTERFDEFLLLLKLEFGWPLKRLLYVRINETKERPPAKSIPQDTIRLIEERNRLDLKLYDYVKDRLDLSLQKRSAQISYLLPTFEALNKLHSLIDRENIEAHKYIERLCDLVDASLLGVAGGTPVTKTPLPNGTASAASSD